MPLPGNFQTVTVNGSYVDLTGAAPNGSIQFDIEESVKALADPTADTIILPKSIVGTIAAGSFSVTLPTTNDPDIVPEFSYKVTESFPGLNITRTYFITIPFNSVSPLNIADIAPVDTPSGTGVAAITVQDEGTNTSTSVRILNFTGTGVTASGTGSTATINVPGGGGGGGYATVQNEGSGLTQRTTLNFIGAGVTAADNSGSSRTDITIVGLPQQVVASSDAPQSWKDAADQLCDGTGDQTEINTAIAALPAGGGIVLLSPGIFHLSGRIDGNVESLQLRGVGAGQRAGATQTAIATRLQVDAGFADTEALRIQRPANDRPLYGVTLRDFTIDGGNVAGVEGLLFRSNRGLVDNVHVHRMGTHGIRVLGYATWATYDTVIRAIQAGDNGSVGLFFDADAQDTHTHGAVLFSNGTNLRIAGGSQQLTSLHTYDGDTHNCVFDGGSRTKIANWKCEGAQQNGLLFDGTTNGASDIVITGAEFADNSRAGNGLHAHIASTGTQAYSRTVFDGLSVSRKGGTVILASYALSFNSAMRDTVISGFSADSTHFATGVVSDSSPTANRTIWGNRNQPVMVNGDGVSGTPRVWLGGSTQPAGIQAGDFWIHDA